MAQVWPTYFHIWVNSRCYPLVLADSWKIFCMCARIGPDVEVASDNTGPEGTQAYGPSVGQMYLFIWEVLCRSAIDLGNDLSKFHA